MVDQTNFRIALIKAGLSQNDLAMRLGIHPNTLSGVVRGWKKMDPSLSQKISEILEVPESEIFPTTASKTE